MGVVRLPPKSKIGLGEPPLWLMGVVRPPSQGQKKKKRFGPWGGSATPECQKQKKKKKKKEKGLGFRPWG